MKVLLIIILMLWPVMAMMSNRSYRIAEWYVNVKKKPSHYVYKTFSVIEKVVLIYFVVTASVLYILGWYVALAVME